MPYPCDSGTRKGFCGETCFRNDSTVGRVYFIEYYDSATGQLCSTDIVGCLC